MQKRAASKSILQIHKDNTCSFLLLFPEYCAGFDCMASGIFIRVHGFFVWELNSLKRKTSLTCFYKKPFLMHSDQSSAWQVIFTFHIIGFQNFHFHSVAICECKRPRVQSSDKVSYFFGAFAPYYFPGFLGHLGGISREIFILSD